jgi:predicted kinase
MTPVCVIPIGPPLSGKSTLCASLRERFGFIVLSADHFALRQGIAGMNSPPASDREASRAFRRCWDDFFTRFAAEGYALLQSGQSIIFDHHHTLTAQRERNVQTARSAGADVWLVSFNVRLTTRQQRRAARNATPTGDIIILSEQQLNDWREVDPIDPAHGRLFVLNEPTFDSDTALLVSALSGRCAFNPNHSSRRSSA